MANISRAVSLLAERVGRIEAVSSPFESAAWGYESENSFRNVGVNVKTGLPAPRIVARLKEIERTIDANSCHRNADGSYADRIIDLDLISLDSEIWNLDNVAVPHPRMHLREFVLVPMSEILPAWRHPLLAMTPDELLSAPSDNNQADNFVKSTDTNQK